MKKSLPNSWRPLGACLLGVLICCTEAQRAVAQPAPAKPQVAPINPQPAQTTDQYLNQLKSASVDRRRDAYQELADFDDRLHMSVLGLLENLKKNPDCSVGGSFEMTLRVVSAMNIRDALDSVGDMIDFQLDPATMPVGGFGAADEYYPVARTVIDLKDGPKTTDLVLTRFGSNASESTLRVYTYVLKGVIGTKVARFVLQDNLDNINKSLAAVPTATELQITKTNLERALKLLDGSESILKMPKGA